MKRLIAIAITIVVFAAVILPTAAVMAYTQTFYESFEEEDLGIGAEGEVWGSYNTQTGYLSTTMRVQPLSMAYMVWAILYVDVDADGVNDLDEPSVETDNTLSEHWLDPIVLSYNGIIPAGAIVRYVVQSTDLVWFDDNWAWGAQWHLSIEDFEWGNDGDSLATSQGNVDWTVWGFWGSGAKIETDPEYVYSGTRSARISKGCFMGYASYEKFRPDYIGCYLMKETTSYPSIWTSDGYHGIKMCITSWGAIQYYDGAGWQDTEEDSINSGEWYLIELRNIDWLDDYTYDIYIGRIYSGDPVGSGIILRLIDWELVESGVPMFNFSGGGGCISYSDSAGRGSFWIDDIYDG